MAKGIAIVTLDLDNLWAFLRAYGDGEWTRYPTFLPEVVPLALQLLDECAVKATVFVVGKDLEAPGNWRAIQEVARSGHELANHSYTHDLGLRAAPSHVLHAEVTLAEEAIAGVGGVVPRGYRGPGFSWSPEQFALLARRGYAYDASVWPTIVGPWARRSLLRRGMLAGPERERLRDIFGTWSDARRPNAAHIMYEQAGQLVEVPVTVTPGARLPLHFTYLCALATWSSTVAEKYLAAALWLCRRRELVPCLVLHLTDLIGGDEWPQLARVPGMRMAGWRKRAMMRRMLAVVRESYHTVRAIDYVNSMPAAGGVEAAAASRRL